MQTAARRHDYKDISSVPKSIKNNLQTVLNGLNSTRPQNKQIVIGQPAPDLNNQQCARLVQYFLPGIGQVRYWRPGISVQGNGANIPVGQPVATFSNFWNNAYQYGTETRPAGVHNMSHTGLYLGQDSGGLYLLNQFRGSGGVIVSYFPWTFAGKDDNDKPVPVSFESGKYYHVISGSKVPF